MFIEFCFGGVDQFARRRRLIQDIVSNTFQRRSCTIDGVLRGVLQPIGGGVIARNPHDPASHGLRCGDNGVSYGLGDITNERNDVFDRVHGSFNNFLGDIHSRLHPFDGIDPVEEAALNRNDATFEAYGGVTILGCRKSGQDHCRKRSPLRDSLQEDLAFLDKGVSRSEEGVEVMAPFVDNQCRQNRPPAAQIRTEQNRSAIFLGVGGVGRQAFRWHKKNARGKRQRSTNRLFCELKLAFRRQSRAVGLAKDRRKPLRI